MDMLLHFEVFVALLTGGWLLVYLGLDDDR